MKKYYTILIGGIIVAVLSIAIVSSINNSPKNENLDEGISLGGLSTDVYDVFGTASTTSTSTSPVTFGNDGDLSSNATSSKIIKIGNNIDEILFTLALPAASSTNFVNWQLMGSNDDGCETATATSTEDDTYPTNYMLEEINWFALNSGDTVPSGYANYSVNDVTIATGTSWTLDNINWKCLLIEYRGASTTALMQMRQKAFK